MRQFARAVAVASIAFAVAVGTARATSVRKMEIAEIGRRADLVLIGTVAGSRARLCTAPGGKTRICTDYELADISTWKGSVDTRNHVVTFAGGTLLGRTLGVEGMPVLEEGRRYLLFLGSREPLCPAIGWGQGIFLLSEGSGDRTFVFQEDGTPVSSAAGGVISGGGAPLELGEFLADLDRAGVRGAGR